ncbi:MAG: rhamnogalacturonan lyase [Bacteroides sp.]|nr:rhamnogalacturonan lyase [Roseburia sp.]MCM1347677.1 rhamnogalacturonan lyase [Bacteroides sp.]MCM1422110.1 rhamnogalacturonan lyase [Bacteroides sp.]
MKLISVVISAFICGSVLAQPKYDYSKIQREELGRSLAAVRYAHGDSVFLSWRYLSSDPINTAFNIYCNGKRLNDKPVKDVTFFRCKSCREEEYYEVRTIDNKKESHRKDGSFLLKPDAPDSYIPIKLDKPADGVTPSGQIYSYSANDASVGDVDGDGEYEIILKWEPSNAHDNSHEGYTGNVYIDCYKLSGEKLWRIDLGPNIRAGAHYTQFMVYDFDNDGCAEIVMKTGDGTVDGQGHCIGDPAADYRFSGVIDKLIDGKMRPKKVRVEGRILTGPEYLTVFNGRTGAAMQTVDYVPNRGNPEDWGDSYGNRCDRFLACVAYLDGIHPSVVMCRGYYTRTVLAAYDWDGKELSLRWVFDTDDEAWHNYAGQGNHNLRVGDVDGDGCDEITYGSMAVDHDGRGLYNTGMGHGDAIHQYAFLPDSERLQIWDVHENKRDGSDFRDAATGEIIFQLPDKTDVGRGMAADIDPENYGLEMWSSASGGIRNVKGEVIANPVRMSINSAVWWDGDLLRELLDKGRVTKYDWREKQVYTLQDFRDECTFNNGTKSNPCLSADILGDWREEIVLRTFDSSELRVYMTTIPTAYRFHTFMEDIPYRISVATENVGYNQPPEPGFYFGSDFKDGTVVRGCPIKEKRK